MASDQWVIFDGELKRSDHPIVPVTSRGLLYGDGCFDTIRVYPGGILRLKDHLDRLERGLDFLNISFPDSLRYSRLKKWSYKLLEANKLKGKDAVIRIQVWRDGTRGYTTRSQREAHFSIIAVPVTPPFLPVNLSVVSTRRIPGDALPSGYKFSNGLNYIIASREAHVAGADDALMLTIDGWISETTIANIFWYGKGKIYTPSKDCDLLPGITRSILIDLIHERSGYVLEQGRYRPEAILGAEAVWICNSVRELVPVISIDGRRYPGDHAVMTELALAFSGFRDHNLEPL